MDFSPFITSAEKKFKKRLEDFFINISENNNHSSHGLDHHQRVWSYAKELLNQSDISLSDPDASFTDGLIIACYLHDSGMAFDKSPGHGLQSRLICEQFLRQNRLPENEFIEVLEAVEDHDNKAYPSLLQPGELLKILSGADDLDAFSFIGIYRYLEIYLTREIPVREIGHLIKENVTGRYNHFARTFVNSPLLVEKHYRRYKVIASFFDKYNRECVDYPFNGSNPSGYCGVAEVIQDMIKLDMKPAELHMYSKKITEDKILNWYFGELENELST
jgi:HD superfamily phosphodiesterase